MIYRERLLRSAPVATPGTEFKMLAQFVGFECLEQMSEICTVLAEQEETAKERNSASIREGMNIEGLTNECAMIFLSSFFLSLGVLQWRMKLRAVSIYRLAALVQT